jgi:aryl-phospho-beta-D-glucosidase BglC (GH1 family)
MTRLTSLRWSFLLIPGILAITGCDGSADEASLESAVAASGSGVTVDVVTTQVWSGGFNGAVRITDTAFPSPITSFAVVFKLGGTAGVSSSWNGNVGAPDASGNRTAINPDWLQFNPIQVGQTWDVGFGGTGVFAGSTIVSLTLNGQNIPLTGGNGSGSGSGSNGDTTAPVVTLTSSATTVTAAGSITLTATATDNSGVVTQVQFFDGTTLLGTDTTSPYTQVVNLTAANNGPHSYTAKARDGAPTPNVGTSPTVVVTVNIGGAGPAVFRVNTQGRITKNGQLFPVHCGSWFGLEGRHEPSNDPTNPSGAPMELYMGNTFWANGGGGTGRTIQQTMTEIVAAGINMVRFPVVPQTLNANDPQGRDPVLKNHASVKIANSRLALETFIKLAAQNGIQVLLDMHSCSNYVGWRKGRLDARPPWVDKDRENYDFKRENFSCAATGNPSTVTTVHAYNETLWLNDLKTLAGLGQQLGVDNIIGIDIYNEPWDYTWAEWKTLTEHAFTAINSVNPNTLLFVQGISGTAGNQDGTPTTITQVPFGNAATNPNWGENLFQAGGNPPAVPKDRLVFSPHVYGPSVFVQRQFLDPAQTACTGLEGDAAGNAKCNIVINPTLLKTGWEEHFGYLKQLGYAVVVGEFGGNLDWPGGQASLRDRARWSYVPQGTDAQWQNAFTDYMVSKGIEGCYWSINPESGDTAGWYGHAYDPVTNTAGWGEWKPFDARKTTLLKKVWGP